MSACLNLYYGAISASFITNRHALLWLALQTARQIELDGNSIWFALPNWFESIIPSF